MTLKIGDLAPDFDLWGDDGKMHTLQALRGKKVILYFYPKDNTPGCTREACDLRDHQAHFDKKNVVVLGVSKDSQTTHAKFKQKHQLPFTLLADTNADVSEAYGVVDKKSLFGKTIFGVVRSTFIIDEAGKIQSIFRKVKVNGHVEQLLNELN